MLSLKIEEVELWDEESQEFRYSPERILHLEHSLLSISKWEAEHHKPFFLKDSKTNQEIFDYVKAMILDLDDDEKDEVMRFINKKHIDKINAYLEDSQTATWFGKNTSKKNKKSGEVVTSELIYYWLVALQIPFEVEKWNFNRLLTLIEICNIKNEKPKNIPRKELYSRNTALNELRRKQMNTHG